MLERFPKYNPNAELEAVIPSTAIGHLNILSKVIDINIKLLFTIDEEHPDKYKA